MNVQRLNSGLASMTMVLVLLLLGWGLAMVFFVVEPFWIDEWRLIGNLKFKSADALWGPLDYTQQFPRVFLQALKLFAGAQDYSYFSLRFPSLLISTASILLATVLMRQLFPQTVWLRYLLLCILISSETFTEYLVQIKQYEMEILLSLVAIWQLIALHRIRRPGIGYRHYLLLCLSFACVPFFSYTYPIAVAPVFLLFLFQALPRYARQETEHFKRTLKQGLPLIIGGSAILGFFLLDVRQLMQDERMHRYWEYRMLGQKRDLNTIGYQIWTFFAEVGSGAVFELIFGILGILALVSGIYRSGKAGLRSDAGLSFLMDLYCVLLLLLVMVLFLTGKLPVGEPKFNAFTVPAISILIIRFLQAGLGDARYRKLSMATALILFLGLAGNILSTIINNYTDSRYTERVHIYQATQEAIRFAQRKQIPIAVTAGVAWPDDIEKEVPNLVTLGADVVLRSWPAYPPNQGIAVYPVRDSGSLYRKFREDLASVPMVLFGDGRRYRVITNPYTGHSGSR